jgi:hypothetical protein
MSSVGFEPTNKSKLKFDALDHSANLTNVFLLFQANCVYGKTMQNVRDYLSVMLHTSRESALKAIAKHTYKNHIILDENLVQTNHFTPTITHDKPIAIGVSILELVNKTIFFQFQLINLNTLPISSSSSAG